MSAKSLVVIHGVGDPVPGNTLRTIHQGLGPEFGSAYREDIVVDGVDYPRLRLGNNSIEEIVEVNWSEIRRPQKSLIGILRHAIYLLIAMLQLSCLPLPKTNAKLTLAKVHRHVFEGILIWCIYPAIVRLFLMSSEHYRQQLATGILTAATLALWPTIWAAMSAPFFSARGGP